MTSPAQSPTPSRETPIDLSSVDPAQFDNSKLPITPIEGLGITGQPQEVDIGTYVLSVDGLVDTPLGLSYQDILRYPSVSEVLLLVCPGFFADNAEWTGVPVTTVLTQTGVRPEATEIVVHSMDGFAQRFPLDDVRREGVFLAYAINGQTLPKEHGYPLRLVVKGKYGGVWVKWVDRLEIK